MLVRVAPGITQVTPMPWPTSSLRSEAENPRLLDGNRAFAGVETEAFTDPVHLTPAGRQALAAAIAAELLAGPTFEGFSKSDGTP